jgi:hypothetical protein
MPLYGCMLAQVCFNISTISKWTEMSFHLSLITMEYHLVWLK